MIDDIFVLSCCKTAIEHAKHLEIRKAIKLLKENGFDVFAGGFKQ